MVSQRHGKFREHAQTGSIRIANQASRSLHGSCCTQGVPQALAKAQPFLPRRSVLIQTRQLTKIEGRSGPGVPSEPLAQNFPGSEADLQPIWVVTTRNGFASTGRLV